MWQCPKCGREFKRRNQSHSCGKAPQTVEENILHFAVSSRHVHLYVGKEAVQQARIAKIARWCCEA